MATLELAVDVAAPPDVVFDITVDFDNMTTHQPKITRIELLTPGPVGKGTRWRESRRVMGTREAMVELEFTQFDPPRSWTATCENMGSRYDTRFEFVPQGAGARVTMVMRSEPRSLLARIAGALAMPAMRKALADDLRTIKAAAECRAAAEKPTTERPAAEKPAAAGPRGG